MKQIRSLAIVVLVLASLALTGCVTYSQPRYGSEGIYYDQTHYRTTTRAHINPVVYPYWSLDYFYFSRHYHPYSVVVHRYDPWFYPYPGWYYGHRPGPRSHLGVSYRYHYPWNAWGTHYGYYRPWQSSMHFSYWHVSTPRHHHYSSRDRVRVEDLRLREMQRRQATADRRTPPHRHIPTRSVSPRMPATSRQQQPHRGHTSETSSRQDRGLLRQRTTSEPRGQPPQSRAPSRDRTRTSPPRTRSESSQPRRDPPPVQRTPSRDTSTDTLSRQDRTSTSSSQSRSEPRTRPSSPPPGRSSALRRSDSGTARSGRSSERRRDRDRH